VSGEDQWKRKEIARGRSVVVFATVLKSPGRNGASQLLKR
jgi:hypothetical protein